MLVCILCKSRAQVRCCASAERTHAEEAKIHGHTSMIRLLLGAARSGVPVVGAKHRLQLQLLLPPPMLLPVWQAHCQ